MVARVRKAVFPVAGFGTRFLPATKAVPKELLPIVDKPLIQYAIDEALAAGIDQMIFVTGRGKGAIEDYFDTAFEIEADLLAKNKDAILEQMAETKLGPGQAAFVRQQQMAGLGHAVWCARHLTGDEPFAVLLPDELLWNPAKPCLSQMMETYDTKGGSVIAVVEVPQEHTGRYGIVDGYGGHGIGTEMHQDPHVLNHGKPGKGPRLEPGLCLAIEPMITMGSPRTTELSDGWTVVTRDTSIAAHVEHTMCLLEDGVWVTTAVDGGRARLGDLVTARQS